VGAAVLNIDGDFETTRRNAVGNTHAGVDLVDVFQTAVDLLQVTFDLFCLVGLQIQVRR
jgi:hypothetical protein